jgi:SAM-dependent methyltransferase
MASAEDPARPSGRYSGEEWKSTVEDKGEYERRRFEQTAEGRAKNRMEQGMVRRFLLRLPPASRVLDVPAGLGRFTELILQTGHHPLSIDLNFGRIEEARRRLRHPVPALQADITQLPLADQSVSAVLCFRLLHHLSPDLIQQVLRELRRVTGRAFVTFYSPHTLKYWKKSFRGKPVSGRYYPPSELIAWAHAAGWKGCRHETPFVFWRILHALDLQA